MMSLFKLIVFLGLQLLYSQHQPQLKLDAYSLGPSKRKNKQTKNKQTNQQKTKQNSNNNKAIKQKHLLYLKVTRGCNRQQEQNNGFEISKCHLNRLKGMIMIMVLYQHENWRQGPVWQCSIGIAVSFYGSVYRCLLSSTRKSHDAGIIQKILVQNKTILL